VGTLDKTNILGTNWKCTMSEKDPFGISPNQPGAKLDAGKAPLWKGFLDYFPRAASEVSKVSLVGASKYTWKGWESVPDGYNRYNDALVRHFTSEATEGRYDYQTGLLHAAHRAWNAMASLELLLRELEKEQETKAYAVYPTTIP